MRPSRSPAVLFYGLAVLLLAVSLAVLFRLALRFQDSLEKRIAAVQQAFADPSILRTPRDPFIRFSEIEALASKFPNEENLSTFTVTKIIGAGERAEEKAVHPFYLEALRDLDTDPTAGAISAENHPLPWKPEPDVRKLELRSGGDLLGHLYLRVDRAPLRNFWVVIGSLMVLLVGAVALFVVQFRRQEIVISATTVELEEKRRELVRLERLALAGQLSANVFHDLKKPVLNIKNEVEELGSENIPGNGTAAAIVKKIKDQVELFFGILREGNLERFVRSQSEREYVDINDMIERSLALVRYERAGVDVTTEFELQLPPVFAEPVRLVQVFSNLILNAYQAMEGKGKLHIATRNEQAGVQATIRDTGPGIPPQDLERIFLPFYTTKPADTGTGLGLYISRDIVRELDGSIDVSSTPEGTTFRIFLPAAQAAVSGSSQK